MTMIGVVIPAYNAASYLGATLESVVRQSAPEWTCVVVDDGSHDATVSIADSYAARDTRIQVLRQQNCGVAAARNRGEAALPAAARYVIFLDHDDCWEPEALALLRSALEATPEASAASGLPYEIDPAGQPMIPDAAAALQGAFGREREGVRGRRLAPWPAQRPSSLETLAVWCHIQTTGLVLIRREAFHAAGGFRPEAVPSDDWDLYLRLALQGPIPLVPRLILAKRSHPENLSLRWQVMKRAEPRIRRDWRDLPNLSPYQRRVLRWGHFYGALLRVRWMRQSLQARQYRAALRAVPRVARALARWVAIEWLKR